MTYPLIVLEGPDGSGKTTLAKALQEKLGGTYIHLTYRFKGRMFDYHTAAIEQCLRHLQTGPVILDRWWASEMVYARAFRGKTEFDMGGRMLDRVGLKHGVQYVLCLPESRRDYASHHQNTKEDRYKSKPHALNGREGMVDDQVKVFDLYRQWDTWMGKREDVIHYDWMTQGENISDMCDNIIHNSFDILPLIPWFLSDRNVRRFAGNPGASRVIVTPERPNKYRRKMWPAFNHSGRDLQLTRDLERFNIPENDIFWCEIIDLNGNPTVNQYDLQVLSESRLIISTTDLTSMALESMGIKDITPFPYPQLNIRKNKERSDAARKLGLA